MADAPVNDMRDWGLPAEGELDRIVVISPHLDDAVLGCAHLIAAHPGTTVISIFTGRPEAYPDPLERWDALCGFVPGDDVLEARRAEDAAALATLDAAPVWLGLVEHQYLPRDAWAGPDAIVDALEAAVREAAPTAVLAPFGLGNPDHDAAHDAAMLVRARVPEPAWFLYEDMGYKHIPGLLAWRVARLFVAGVWPTPAALPVDVDARRKQAAVDCYPSQLRALEADWQIGAKLAAPAPEQFWRLAPPPPGWERLSEPAGLGITGVA
ncbi:MAG: PIG-L family deacetylase [Acidimicrobiia bacterium]|jgi:LmbE family N-acetylglucosaminyl deacetylase